MEITVANEVSHREHADDVAAKASTVETRPASVVGRRRESMGSVLEEGRGGPPREELSFRRFGDPTIPLVSYQVRRVSVQRIHSGFLIKRPLLTMSG